MRIRYAAKTDVGMKRSHNEDYFSLLEQEKMFIVADGMGGHASGEVASKLSGEVISEFYEHSKDMNATWPFRYDPSLSYPENRMVAAIRLANTRIFNTAQKNPNLRGMGTTIVGLMFVDKFAYVAHVGDSRCYRVADDQIEQLTRDHSLLEDYKDARPDMSEEEAKNFPHKNVITRALGMRDEVMVDIQKYLVADNDIFILCSDGLSGMVDDQTILRLVLESNSLEAAVSALIDSANQNGGNDNITAMLIQCNL
ncbi:MAG: Stp1/IreP family PP2C-type Ser/Thr phosphatase [Nannocystaceae bacterium]|nr:Stp1/IreP family PP2C-type Ser/Thr phosphatase [Myxococcales bacterium]